MARMKIRDGAFQAAKSIREIRFIRGHQAPIGS
jgi:hypothetical protein